MFFTMTQEEKTIWDELGPVLSAEEVAEFLKISLSTVKRYLYSGQIKGKKVGRQWRVSRDDLRKYWEDTNGGS